MSANQSLQMPALAWLAPMSGSTDAPFRRQAVKFGAKAVVSEMVAGESLVAGRPDVVRRMCRHEGVGPWIVQLAARRPEDMRAGADLLSDAGVDVIDINMGCPAKQVTGGQSGSALMRDLDLATRIIDAAIEGGAGTPVSLKMRLGWDHDTLNAPELAQIAERLGVCWVTVHGRTRSMFYKGRADWSAISATAKNIDIPVVANGDIGSLEDAETAVAESGAKAVMIGRAAMGQPWLIGQLEASLSGTPYRIPDLEAQFQGLAEQIQDSVDLYGDRLGVRIVRKHVSAAIDQIDLPAFGPHRRAVRSRLCQIDDAAALIHALESLYAGRLEPIAA
ncbi:MAG: tRNA-dihydrouridine synthase family protein [Pseudomonadota bacterium]